MRLTRLTAVVLVLGVGCAQAAQQVDLPLCKSGDGKMPVPRWEVNASPVAGEKQGQGPATKYSVPYPPPVAHGVLSHLRVKLGDLDMASCAVLIDHLKQIGRETGQSGPLVVQWQAEDTGAPDDVRSLDFYELPRFENDGCWLEGVYQFVALGHSNDAKPEEFLVNQVPIEALQKEGSFCRPVQEG